MFSNTVDCDIIEMTCRQMGAENIKKINGTLYYFEFDINEKYKLSYTFNVNSKNEYRLRRIEPYAFFRGNIDSASKVIELMKSDLARFRNAANSSNFETFVKTVNEIHAIGEEMDDMFLNFNVDKEALNAIKDQLQTVQNQINGVKDNASAITVTISED